MSNSTNQIPGFIPYQKKLFVLYAIVGAESPFVINGIVFYSMLLDPAILFFSSVFFGLFVYSVLPSTLRNFERAKSIFFITTLLLIISVGLFFHHFLNEAYFLLPFMLIVYVCFPLENKRNGTILLSLSFFALCGLTLYEQLIPHSEINVEIDDNIRRTLYIVTIAYLNIFTAIMAILMQKKVAELLTEQNGLYKSLFDNSQNAVYLWDAKKNKVLNANSKFKTIYGYSDGDLEELDTRSLNTLYQRNGQKSEVFLNGLLSKVNSTKVATTSRIQQLRKNGDTFPSSISVIPYLDEESIFLIGIHDMSEIEDALKRLQIKERSSRMLIEKNISAVVNVLEDLSIVEWNDSAKRIFQWDKKDVLSKSVIDVLIPLESKKVFELFFKKYMRSGDEKYISKPMELNSIRKDGQIIPIMVSFSHIRIGDEHLFSAFITDLSAQKTAEFALEKSKRRYKSIVDSSPSGIAVFAKDGVLKYSSKRADKLFGYSHEDLEDARIEHFVPEYELEKLINYFQGLIKGEGNNQINFDAKHKSGRVFPVECYTNTDSEVEESDEIFLVFNDITDKRKAEDDLIKREATLNAILESNPDSIYAIDRKYRVVSYNRTAKDEFAETGLELRLNRDLRELLDSSVFEKWNSEVFLKVFEGNEVVKETERISNNSENIYENRYTPVINNKGKIIGCLESSRNITESRNLEKVLKEKNYELSKINEELDSIIYKVAHDLRAPLTNVMGLIDLAINHPTQIDHKDFMRMQKTSVLRMDSFIRDVVNFSKNVRMGVIDDLVNINDLVEECIDLYEENAIQRNVRIVRDVRVKEFRTDEMRLSMIMNNLISNAIHYSDQKKKESTILISAERIDEQLIIEVKDNGQGIEERFIEKIFEMFFRANKYSAGSGLGLYIVKESMTKLGGLLELESKLGEFTNFKLTIDEIRISKDQDEENMNIL